LSRRLKPPSGRCTEHAEVGVGGPDESVYGSAGEDIELGLRG
jgi:hypothetical protein